MQINKAGHVVNNEGITTTPHASSYWIGDDLHRVAFDYLLLGNDRVVLHAVYGNVLREYHSEYFYDVIDNSKALACAKSLVSSATLLLQAHCPDIDFDTDKVDDFLLAVAGDIAKCKRVGFYIVSND